MRAAVFHTPQDFRVEEVPYPKIEAGGVIVKVKACGICGSDLHFYNMGRRDGAILGHEFGGDVAEVGSGVRGVKKGDRVVAMSGRGCGECYWCQKGEFIRCSKLQLLSYGFPGAFAEYVLVPNFKIGSYAAKLPDKISYEEGATAEPLSVALYAVEQMQPKEDDVVAVIGMGIIGIFIVQILKSMGIKQIFVSGRRAKRLQLAEAAGAKIIIDASKDDPVAAFKQAFSKGADIVFECAGTAAAYEQAVQMVHRGGKIDMVGLYEKPLANWNPGSLITGDLSLIGCGLQWMLQGAIDLFESGKADGKPLITHEFPLERIKEAFETQIHDQNAIKVLIKP
jgi:2-desacetyl-2-hydroxyethyl bacteriochlorophyllide A dehydrogenase